MQVQSVEAKAEEARALKEELAVLLEERVRREEQRLAKEAQTPAYAAFRKKYRNRPELFARDCIRWGPGQGLTEYQDEILLAVVEYFRACVRGPHTLGKTTILAIAILWFALTRDGEDWKCPTTAGAWRQLEKFLWPEVHKWAKRLRWEVIGRPAFNNRTELHDLSLKLTTGEAFALASDNPELIEGAHADCLLYILDECKAIPNPIFDSVEGAFAGAGHGREAYALAASTPGGPGGKFYEIQSRKPGTEDWKAIFVTFKRVLKAGRISLTWARQRAKDWGEKSAVFLNRVLGEFVTENTDAVIPLTWVEAANERWLEWHDKLDSEGKKKVAPPWTGLGVDVGRGGDPSTIIRRHEWLIISMEKHSTPDTMALVGKVDGILSKYGGYAVIDVIGVGAGSVDRLREKATESVRSGGKRYTVYAFNASEKTKATDRSGEIKFVNKRSHGWWNLREMLDPTSEWNMALPPDDELTGDLTAATYRDTSSGRRVEEKEDIKKRLGRSPDLGDGVMQACYPTAGLQGDIGGIMESMQRRYDELQAAKAQAKESGK